MQDWRYIQFFGHNRTMAAVLDDAQCPRSARGDLRRAERAWTAGPLLIIAGAGTGKTNTLAHRVAHLVLNGVAPERILLLTFSRRASQEMIRRARRIVAKALTARADGDDKAPGVARLTWAGTFHSIANRLLRRYAAQRRAAARRSASSIAATRPT